MEDNVKYKVTKGEGFTKQCLDLKPPIADGTKHRKTKIGIL